LSNEEKTKDYENFEKGMIYMKILKKEGVVEKRGFLYTLNICSFLNQLSRQTGNRNLTGPKTLPTIWGTYMKLVTKYQISAINSC
jgi:hypothetical protein